MVTEENCTYWWGLFKSGNGNVFDSYGEYGQHGVVYGRLVDGMAVPL